MEVGVVIKINFDMMVRMDLLGDYMVLVEVIDVVGN